jgi:hypothetical protein
MLRGDNGDMALVSTDPNRPQEVRRSGRDVQKPADLPAL